MGTGGSAASLKGLTHSQYKEAVHQIVTVIKGSFDIKRETKNKWRSFKAALGSEKAGTKLMEQKDGYRNQIIETFKRSLARMVDSTRDGFILIPFENGKISIGTGEAVKHLGDSKEEQKHVTEVMQGMMCTIINAINKNHDITQENVLEMLEDVKFKNGKIVGNVKSFEEVRATIGEPEPDKNKNKAQRILGKAHNFQYAGNNGDDLTTDANKMTRAKPASRKLNNN